MTTTLTIRMDDALKADAEDLFEDIGLTMTTALTCFLKKCLAVGGIPFALAKQSREERINMYLREAEEAINDPSTPRCKDPAKLKEFLFS